MAHADTFPIRCGHCGQGVAAKVVAYSDNKSEVILWLECPLCLDGSVKASTGAVYPGALPDNGVSNLPEDVEAAWREARTAHAAGAYTAAEIVCRKILMHVAVGVAGSAPGKSFEQYVNDLDAAGYISAGLRDVVDQVRKRGNIANHELSASMDVDALRTHDDH